MGRLGESRRSPRAPDGATRSSGSRRLRRPSAWCSPSSGSSEQVQKTSVPPGLSRPAARSIIRPGAPASAAMSAGCFSQAMSGWRRMVPVAVQGASSRIASNGSLGLASRGHRRRRFGRELQPREVGRDARRAARSEMSTAVTWAPAAASCAVLPPGAAQRSATRLPRTSPRRRRREARPRRPAPTMRRRRSRARSSIGPPASMRTEPVGQERAAEPRRPALARRASSRGRAAAS